MEHASDQEVVSAVLAGDMDAYAVLVERYQKPIYNLMVRMTGSCVEARDLAQETFIKAYEALERFHMDRRFFPWLYSIGLNHAKNFLRRTKAHPTVAIDDLDHCPQSDGRSDQGQGLMDRLDAMDIRQALGRLPVDYREAVVLRFHEGLSMEEIAGALRISPSGAKMRIHRGLQKLRTILEKTDEGQQNRSR